MSLRQRIEDDLKAAMLARDSFTVDTLRMTRSAIINEEVDRGEREQGLSDVLIESILTKEVKKRHEAAALFDRGGNSDSAQKERREAEVLQSYLPDQLSDEELVNIVSEVFAEAGSVSRQEMGRLIGLVKQRVGGGADGARIASIVKEKIA